MLPGVQTTSDFSSALYVRGSTPDQNLIMLDGIVVYNPYHLGGIFSTFNTDAIKEADFHAGGFPARHGGRMGAILNVINREGNSNKITGMANISLISSKGLLEGPLPKWRGMKGSWMVSGRRTYFDSIINGKLLSIQNRIKDLDLDSLGDHEFFFDGGDWFHKRHPDFYELEKRMQTLDSLMQHKLERFEALFDKFEEHNGKI